MKTKFRLLFYTFFISFYIYSQAPPFQWAKSIGQGMNDIGYSIAVDGSGNVYTLGTFHSQVDFDPGPGTFSLISSGSEDIFILKLDASGNFLWAKGFGGPGIDCGTTIVLDNQGNICITGSFSATVDFDPSPATYSLTSAGNDDIFFLKLDANGNFLFAKSIGGIGSEASYGLAIDPSDNIHITGWFQGTCDFDPSAGLYNINTNGMHDIFILKLNSNGNFVWVRKIGGTSEDVAFAIAVDAFGNIYTTGEFQDTVDFDPGIATFNLNTVWGSDIFISKLDATGNFVWAKSFGGSSWDRGTAITTDNQGNIYSTGRFYGSVDFDPSPATFTLTSSSSYDAFTLKLDALGNFNWAIRIGGTSNVDIPAIKVDVTGNVFLAGWFFGTCDFDPSPSTNIIVTAGYNEIFISKLGPSGNLIYVQSMGATETDFGMALALDNFGNIYTTGAFVGVIDFDCGLGTYTMSSSPWSQDIFILKTGPGIVGFEPLIHENGTNPIFPNPNNGTFEINLNENAEVIITDAIGKIVFTTNKIKGKHYVYLSDFPSGIYLLSILSVNRESRHKIIKQ